MFTNQHFEIQYLSIERYNIELLFLILFFVVLEWFSREKEEPISGRMYWFKLSLIISMIIALGSYSNPQDFIYFQF